MTDYKGPNKSSGPSRPPKEWQEEEIAQLTQLLEDFRDATGLSLN